MFRTNGAQQSDCSYVRIWQSAKLFQLGTAVFKCWEAGDRRSTPFRFTQLHRCHGDADHLPKCKKIAHRQLHRDSSATNTTKLPVPLTNGPSHPPALNISAHSCVTFGSKTRPEHESSRLGVSWCSSFTPRVGAEPQMHHYRFLPHPSHSLFTHHPIRRRYILGHYINTLRTGKLKLFKCAFPGSKQFKSTFILCFFKYL